MRQGSAAGPGFATPNPALLSALVVSVVLTWLVPVRFLPRGIWWVAFGAALMAAGVGLRQWGLATMRRCGTDPDPHGAASRLVAEGPFRFTRNPIYLGVLVVLLGAAVAGASVWLLGLAGAGVVVASRQIRLEERYMAATFGDEYERYRRRVRRWL